MTEIQRLGQILAKLRAENERNKSVATHYFIIKYTDDLQQLEQTDLEAMLAEAGVPKSWLIEIPKMLKLSKYVSIKRDM